MLRHFCSKSQDTNCQRTGWEQAQPPSVAEPVPGKVHENGDRPATKSDVSGNPYYTPVCSQAKGGEGCVLSRFLSEISTSPTFLPLKLNFTQNRQKPQIFAFRVETPEYHDEDRK